jgi:hypothetical protein
MICALIRKNTKFEARNSKFETMTKIRNVLKAQAAILQCSKQILLVFRSFEFRSLRLRLENSTDLFRISAKLHFVPCFGFRIYDIVFGSPM